MKRIFLIFLFLSALAVFYLENQLKKPQHFVCLKDKKFMLDEKPFFPITINYLVTLEADENEMWPSSYNGYNPDEKYQFVTKDSSLMQLKAEMDLMKEMGFNTIRIVRVGEEVVDDKNTGALSTRARIRNQRDTILPLINEKNYNKYFDALDQMFKIAEQAGLKVIFLVNVLPEVKSTENHLMKLAIRFKDTPSLMAYDMFNEPLYFDPVERDKKFVHKKVGDWQKIIDTYAPHQLTTIGLEGIREVFEWDPNILDVDFISVHPYEYEQDQVNNEIYWYGKYIKKPWMLGETAISADDDSVKYEEQKKFAEKTLKRTLNCGAIGYSWWQYKDVNWHLYHANYLGVVNWFGETRTQKKNIPLRGTVKPVAQAFKNFDPNMKQEGCPCLDNYYNYSKNKKRNFRIVGKMVDENDKPIEGGVVLGWNQYWSHSYHTVTLADGTFELLSEYPFYHWMASATEFTMVRGEIIPDTAKQQPLKLPTINLGGLKVKRVSL